MTRVGFEQLYEQTRAKAVDVAARAVGNLALAEEAVQDTAVEFLIHLDARERITPAMFIRRTVDRAKDKAKPHGRTRATDTVRPEIPMGSVLDLDHALYGPDVE